MTDKQSDDNQEIPSPVPASTAIICWSCESDSDNDDDDSSDDIDPNDPEVLAIRAQMENAARLWAARAKKEADEKKIRP